MADFATTAAECRPPDDGEAPSLGALRIRNITTMLEERLGDYLYGLQDDDSELDALLLGAKHLPLYKQASKPTARTNFGMFYTKEVSSVLEAFYEYPDGTEIQLTNNGKVAGFTTGMIMLWSGTIATIPSGWNLCDGTNGTPDLRNKFVVAANADDGGVAKSTVTGAAAQTGGDTSHNHGGATASHVLTTAEIPAHAHTIPAQVNADPTGGVHSVGSTQNTTTNTTGSTGGGGGHTHNLSTDDHLPPFYALAYIMKL